MSSIRIQDYKQISVDKIEKIYKEENNEDKYK